MTLIDRYIVKKYFLFFMAGIIVFATIFLAFDSLSTMVRFDVGGDVLFRYYSYYLPGILYQMIPVAGLLATVFTLTSLQKSHELMALFSLGMSLWRVSIPILSCVVVIAGLNFWVGDQLLPKFNRKKNYVYYVEIRKKPGSFSTVKTNKIWYRSGNILFYLKTLNANQNLAQGISLYYFDSEWNLLQLISAATVKMSGNQWQLSKGTVTLFTTESSFPLTQNFESKVIEMSEDVADIQNSEDSSDSMDSKDLNKFIERNKDAGLDTLKYEVDFHSKMSFPLSILVMSMMGIPFSISRHRGGGGLMNVTICIGLAFLYWSIYSSSLTLGKHGLIPPILAAWLPNFLLGLGAYIMIYRKRM